MVRVIAAENLNFAKKKLFSSTLIGQAQIE